MKLMLGKKSYVAQTEPRLMEALVGVAPDELAHEFLQGLDNPWRGHVWEVIFEVTVREADGLLHPDVGHRDPRGT